MPTLRHRVIAREHVAVIDPADSRTESPVELQAAADAACSLVPDSCG